MGSVSLEGFGGGGNPLNFKVVGGTSEPNNPKENTIWVNTDTPISGYHFGNEEPLGNALTLATQYDGMYGTLDGTIVQDSNYTMRVFHIPTGIRKICIRIDNYSASNAAHTFFDKDSNVISPFYRQAGYAFHDVPDNAAYVVLAARSSETVSVTGANPEEGMVWISTGTSSTVPFNALKKHGIMVYPLSAKQYVNGAWVERVAKSYQNGAWVEWIKYLYNAGDQCTSVTGGWGAKSNDTDWKANGWLLKCTFNSDNMYMASASESHYGGAGTAKKLDLSSYTTLKASVKVTEGSLYMYAATAVGEISNTSTNVAAKTNTSTTSTHTISLNISSISSAYVVFSINGKANVYKVWLE